MENNPPEQPGPALGQIRQVGPEPYPEVGIGGWLILVIIGLVVSSLRTVYLLATTLWPIFRDDVWHLMTTPGTAAYHPLWGPLIALEFIGNVGIIAIALTTLYYLFRKSRRTPKLAILWYAWGLGFVALDAYMGSLIPAVASQPDADGSKELIKSVVAAAIWIPYFMVSKRVKATFVN